MNIYKNQFTGTVRMYEGKDFKNDYVWSESLSCWQPNRQSFKLTASLPFYQKLDEDEMKEYE